MKLHSEVEHFSGTIHVTTTCLGMASWVLQHATHMHNYETALLLPGGGREVVGWYRTEAEATAGHAAFSNPQVVRFIEQIRDTRNRLQMEV